MRHKRIFSLGSDYGKLSCDEDVFADFDFADDSSPLDGWGEQGSREGFASRYSEFAAGSDHGESGFDLSLGRPEESKASAREVETSGRCSSFHFRRGSPISVADFGGKG